MFLAFAFLFPDTVFRLYFLIPIKAKWLGYIYILLNVVEIVQYAQTGDYRGYMRMLLIVAALLDFVIFYAIAREPHLGMRMKQAKKRRVIYKNTAQQAGQPRHKCAICGRTEIDSPQLEFRYCSKCEGSYEYCSDHLFTHEHVKSFRVRYNEQRGKDVRDVSRYFNHCGSNRICIFCDLLDVVSGRSGWKPSDRKEFYEAAEI